MRHESKEPHNYVVGNRKFFGRAKCEDRGTDLRFKRKSCTRDPEVAGLASTRASKIHFGKRCKRTF